MLMAALQNGHHIWLVIFAVLMAAVSAYYYFRVIQAMYFREPSAGDLHVTASQPGFRLMLLIVAALIVALGLYPEFLIGWMYH
jgi:NADH-quinone oxidoreductase subunit N